MLEFLELSVDKLLPKALCKLFNGIYVYGGHKV